MTVRWQTCDQDDCLGVRLDSGKCLAHATDRDRKAALQQIARSGEVDARGVTIASDLLEQILAAVPSDSDGHAVFARAMFEHATFTGEALFDRATFRANVWFDRATFQAAARFEHAVFHAYAGFDQAIFNGNALFREATFTDRAHFNHATFHAHATFYNATFRAGPRFGTATFRADAWFAGATLADPSFGAATFHADAWFGGATFTHEAVFRRATFKDKAVFSEVTFRADAWFDSATFKAGASFGAATFQASVGFVGAAFDQEQYFGPVLVQQVMDLDGVQFSQPVVIEASTTALSCRQARFPGGVQFRLRWARIALDDTDLSIPSLLTGISRLASDKLADVEQGTAEDWRQAHGNNISEQPRLMSLRRANLAALGLSNINLAGCRFAGAHNLDLLRLDGDITFGLSPARAGWERRQVIAEEISWRASRPRQGQWTTPQWPDWAGATPPPLDPGAVAGLYRALRKGREDAKDEPGAADFYYGEMEMRRHTSGPASERDNGSRGRVDRGVLTVYWLASGYGLRAWRAFTWLGAVIAVFALAFHLVGFTSPPRPATYWTSLLYAFRSTLSLSDDTVGLTNWGQLLQALLRLTGPVLLGLGLLALRARVKR